MNFGKEVKFTKVCGFSIYNIIIILKAKIEIELNSCNSNPRGDSKFVRIYMSFQIIGAHIISAKF